MTLLQPADAESLRYRIEFSWTPDFELQRDERFEVVFWEDGRPRDVSAYGFIRAGTYNTVLVNLDKYSESHPQWLRTNQIYRWAVRVIDGEGNPIQWVSDERTFTYSGP